MRSCAQRQRARRAATSADADLRGGNFALQEGVVVAIHLRQTRVNVAQPLRRTALADETKRPRACATHLHV